LNSSVLWNLNFINNITLTPVPYRVSFSLPVITGLITPVRYRVACSTSTRTGIPTATTEMAVSSSNEHRPPSDIMVNTTEYIHGMVLGEENSTLAQHPI
jgi:hypothetical protein